MFKIKNIIAVLVAAMMTVGFAACGSDNTEPKSAEENQTVTEQNEDNGGEIFSNIALTDMEGNEVDSSIFENNKLTMVNVWATFCSPCIEEMPGLGKLAEEYAKEDGGVQIIGVAFDLQDKNGEMIDGQQDVAKEIIELTGADYLHLIPDNKLLQFLRENLPGVPGTYFVDSEGKFVGELVIGARSVEQWQEVVNERLGMLEK